MNVAWGLMALRAAVHRSGTLRTTPRRLRLWCSASAPSAPPRSVLVVGGGAAGLTAAYFAQRAGARVLILERNGEAGKKILMSGGTRANVLPFSLDASSDFFTSSSHNALRRLLLSWPLDEVRDWLSSELGIPLALEPDTGKWFPAANSGRAVRDALLSSSLRAGARISYRASVSSITRSANGQWCVRCDGGAEHSADAVVLATGGLSFPAVGTDGTGHRIAAQELGHSLQRTFPALTPLHGPHPGGESLAGVSLQTVVLRAGEGAKAVRAHRGGLLFSHKGWSGPAVLDLSHRYVVARQPGVDSPPPPFTADWTGEGRPPWESRLSAPGAQLLTSRIAQHMPARLAAALLAHCAIPVDRKAAELRKEERSRLLIALTAFPLPITGDGGYSKAEVTGGGVPLSELRLETMESRTSPGVFLCGELVDAFGRIGGFNFLLAWNTGRLAGRGAAACATQQAGAERRANASTV